MQSLIIEPPLYFAEDHIWNVSFHPHLDLIACCEISGAIEILKYSSDDVVSLIKISQAHKSSARDCKFNPSGNLLASCAKDKRLSFIDSNGKVAHLIKKAHESSINRVKFIDDQTLVSGDDDGVVKIWDLRTSSVVFEAEEQQQAITGILYQSNSNYLITTSLEGTIAAYDCRVASESNRKLVALSDSVDQQLLGIQIIKSNRYIACPSSEGCIFLYKWGDFQNAKDTIQGHPNSVDAVIKLDQNTLITGSQDGFVRGVGIHPNKVLDTLGQHQQQQHFPIQSLSISHCRNIIASSSHDSSIKFYDISQFAKKRMNVLQGEEEVSQVMQKQQKQNSEDDYYSDDSSQSEESIDLKPKKNKNRKINLKIRQQQIKKEKKKSFFKDL